ncbi:MAG: hypothetical protein VX938_04860, partial [Myxococcota bacterium]|nr:hypothetical protein [Myxococcota bacterium]
TGAPPRLLGLSVATDAVVDDDTSNWLDGDRTYQALAAVRGRYGHLHGGLYFVHRVQEHQTGGRTRVEVLDAYVHNTLVRGPIRAWFEAELAGVVGETTYVSAATEPGPFEIFSSGGVIRAGLNVGDLSAVVESGVASGDNNPFDNKLREFSFDRSFKVGLLMFSEGLRQTTAVSAYNVADPTLRGTPPPGIDRIPSGGAVRGATYVNPRVVWTPSPHFALYLGYVHAESEEDYTDPFQSGLAGGESRGPFGAPGQRNLGDEVDVGVATSFGATDGARFKARLEAGWWRPGSVFQDPEGVAPGDIKGLTATMEASW